MRVYPSVWHVANPMFPTSLGNLEPQWPNRRRSSPLEFDKPVHLEIQSVLGVVNHPADMNWNYGHARALPEPPTRGPPLE